MHRDDFLPNVKLQLFALIAKQQAFHQLRSVEQLGYITELMLRYRENKKEKMKKKLYLNLFNSESLLLYLKFLKSLSM